MSPRCLSYIEGVNWKIDKLDLCMSEISTEQKRLSIHDLAAVVRQTLASGETEETTSDPNKVIIDLT